MLPPELWADPAFVADSPEVLAEVAEVMGPPPPAVDTSVDQSPIPLDEESVALMEAARTGSPVEVPSETTETSIRWAQPDGSVRVESAAAPVRTEADGDWVDVDTTLRVTEDGVEPVAVTGEIVFSPGGDVPMATIGDDDARLSLTWPEELPEPELNGDTATYRDVFPDVDLVLTATRVGFQQHLIVNSRPSAATLSELQSLAFDIASEGVTVEEGDGGDLQLVDASGDAVGAALPPVMWDARTDAASGGPAVVRDIGLDVEGAGSAQADATLVLTPPRSFLTAADTVYPVTIDPTHSIGAWDSTYVQSNIANTPQVGSAELPVGTWNGGGQKNIALLLFDVEAAQDRVVQSATLSLWEMHSYSFSPRWVDIRDAGYWEPWVTWNTRPWIGNIVANANVAYGHNSSCPANWVNFNVTGTLQSYADLRNGRGPDMPLAVTASSDTDSYGWKKFSSGYQGTAPPTLSFTYDGNCDQFDGSLVCGAIRDRYYAMGGPNSWLGLPVTGQTGVNGGSFNHFEGGSIYASPSTGAHAISGAIRDKWASLGWENSWLGFPTAEMVSQSGGFHQHFQNGSVFAHPATGVFTVTGSIRTSGRRWAGRTPTWGSRSVTSPPSREAGTATSRADRSTPRPRARLW
ncbi:LGFP repeat-containing protein [Trujillonella endophytica]|uniref:LGFP repeat-containing protein n=1 Tax=Trujillonella endophytica TaxID=673521 RepID=A0A1H8R4W8_9ACTN|nr:LGFP repeat-containing protein [Trujillella endophytica]